MLWWILRQLKAEEAKTRETAARKLSEFKERRAAEGLISLLNDPSSGVRRAAEESLVTLGTAAVKSLIGHFRSDQAEDRRKAGAILAAIGQPSIRALGTALHDENPEICQAAAAALTKIGGESAIQQFVFALENGAGDLKATAAAGLVRLGSPAVQHLLSAREHPDREVRETAGDALQSLGVNPGRKNKKPAISGRREPEKAGEKILDRLECVRTWARARSLESVRRLMEALEDGDPNVRGAACTGLYEIGTLKEEPLPSALRSGNRSVARAAAHALAELGDDRAREILRGDLHDDSALVLLDAAESLERLGDVSPVNPLLEFLRFQEELTAGGMMQDHLICRTFGLLKRFLSARSREIAAEDLLGLFYLPEKQAENFRPYAGGTVLQEMSGPGTAETGEVIDWFELRELARRELARRKLKA